MFFLSLLLGCKFSWAPCLQIFNCRLWKFQFLLCFLSSRWRISGGIEIFWWLISEFDSSGEYRDNYSLVITNCWERKMNFFFWQREKESCWWLICGFGISWDEGVCVLCRDNCQLLRVCVRERGRELSSLFFVWWFNNLASYGCGESCACNNTKDGFSEVTFWCWWRNFGGAKSKGGWSANLCCCDKRGEGEQIKSDMGNTKLRRKENLHSLCACSCNNGPPTYVYTMLFYVYLFFHILNCYILYHEIFHQLNWLNLGSV